MNTQANRWNYGKKTQWVHYVLKKTSNMKNRAKKSKRKNFKCDFLRTTFCFFRHGATQLLFIVERCCMSHWNRQFNSEGLYRQIFILGLVFFYMIFWGWRFFRNSRNVTKAIFVTKKNLLNIVITFDCWEVTGFDTMFIVTMKC